MVERHHEISAQRVIDFVSLLTHTTGPAAGSSFVLRDWQKDIVDKIYAPTYEDGRRKTRTALVTIPRKNGKTELAAALVLFHLLGDNERGAQVYSCAADRQQAALIFNCAAAMIRNDPELSEMINIIESQKRLVHYDSGSFYQALSSEAKTKHGYNASFIVYDEMAQAPNRHLWDVLTTSTGARAQPLSMIISTMSPDKHSVMFEQYDYGVKVRDGIIEDETFVPIIYQAPEDADIWDEETWFACNPALGDFRSLEEMQTFAARAKRIPAAEAAFRNLYLNQMVDAEQRFLSSTDWLAGKEEIDVEALRGRKCWGGLDLSSTTDLTALVLIFPMPDGSFKTLCRFWVPADNLRDRADRDRVPYPVWRDQGHIIATPGRAIDKDFIIHSLGELSTQYDIQSIAYDRWRIKDLLKQLADEGIDINMIEWGQGYKDMGPAVDHLETCVVNKTLRHNSPVLDWCASNSVVTTDPAGARKINKEKCYEKVDGIVALAMALGVYHREPPPVESAYNSGQGLTVLSF